MKRLLAILLLLATAAPDLFAQGCAMCKAVSEQSDDAAGINGGILWLIPIPYILLFLLFRKQLRDFWRELSSARG
ncbi:MAG: hypothetical protein ABI599_01075 [Flavobacteriales bacterium]